MSPLLPSKHNYFSGWKNSNADIYLISIAASIIMSIWVISMDDLINNDGYDYLTMALAVTHHGPSIIDAQLLWPLPSTIAAIASILHINLELAAYLISTIAFVIITTAFLSITRELGGNRSALIWSAITILTLPYMNEGRSEILRDHIYWAAFLTALLFFLRHSSKPSWKHAIAWNAAILVGGIFRTEGFIIMALLPPILILNRSISLKTRLHSIFQAYSLTAALIMIMAIGAATGLLTLSYDIVADRMAVIVNHAHQVISSIQGSLSEKADTLRKALLEPLAKEFDMPAIISIIALIIIGKTIKTLTPLHSLLLLTTHLHTKLNFLREHSRTIVALSLINLAILVGFVSYQFFLQARYTMALSFTLLLPIPFILANIYNIWQTRRSNQTRLVRIAPVIAITLVIMLIDILTSLSPSRSYVTEAATWFQSNIPAGRPIVTNESSFPYYVNRGLPPAKFYRFPRPPEGLDSLPQHTSLHKRYFPNSALPPSKSSVMLAAVRTKKGQIPENWKAWIAQHNATLLNEFNNQRNDGIQIYEINRTGPQSSAK